MSLKKIWMAGLAGLLPMTMLAQATPAAQSTPTTPNTPAAVSTGPAQVQTGGTKVHGTITDPDGAMIPGATVTLTPAKGPAKTVKSGDDGSYSITVAPGTYTVLVSMQGFSSFLMTGLKVPAVASTTLDAKLQIGVENQVVNVEANAITLSVDPDSNASSSVISGKDLDALSDDPDELQSELTALAGPSAGPNGGQIYVDGFTGGQLPPKSSIREIRINQNPFSAEYDRLGYGRIEVFTKPGTDKLHGNFQVNGEPSQFDSGNPFATPNQPAYHTTFVFGNLTGPLSPIASYNIGGSYRDIEDDELTNNTIFALPGSTTLCAPYNPLNPGANAGCVSTPYQIATYFPQHRFDINPRLDLALGDKNVLTTRYQFVRNNSTNEGAGNLTLPTAAYNSTSMSNELQMSDTQTFSSRLINETRFEYEREHVATKPLSNAATISVSGNFVAGGYSGQSLTDHQDHWEVQNYTSLALKKNFIRFGGRLRATREAEDTEGGTNGSFQYSSLTYYCPPNSSYTLNGTTYPCTTTTSGQYTAADNSYATGTPRQLSYTVVNNHKIGDTFTDVGLYAETDWKPMQNFTLSYGVRYETQNHLGDHHDFAPRISFNYGLFAGKGAPKTVLRGGFGMFYDRFSQGNILTLELQNGTNETIYNVTNPGTSCTPVVGQPFPTACKGQYSASTQQTYSVDGKLRTPYIIQEALGADQQLGRAATISVNYLHSHGVHQLATQNLGYSGSQTIPSTSRYQYFSEGVFDQNQLIVNGRVATSKRISLFGYYSLNYANGDTSGAGSFITVPGNIKADYGRTTFAVRNRLFLAGSITLPHFIQLSPFMIAQSGRPYNITTGSDLNNDNIFNDRPALGPANNVPAGQKGTNTIAGCGSFVAPPSGTNYTAIPINYCTGPSLFTLNFRLTKTIGFGGMKSTANTNQAGGDHQHGRGGDGGPGGPGGPGGSHSHGGGGGSSHGGGPGFFGGGGTSTGQRYNLSFGLQVQNVFGNKDLGTPQGVLSSQYFGQSTQLVGMPYTSNVAERRISLQTSFTF